MLVQRCGFQRSSWTENYVPDSYPFLTFQIFRFPDLARFPREGFRLNGSCSGLFLVARQDRWYMLCHRLPFWWYGFKPKNGFEAKLLVSEMSSRPSWSQATSSSKINETNSPNLTLLKCHCAKVFNCCRNRMVRYTNRYQTYSSRLVRWDLSPCDFHFWSSRFQFQDRWTKLNHMYQL